MNATTPHKVNPLDHQGLVKRIANKYRRYAEILDFDDLNGEGQIGLLEACESFDPSKGFRFSTYATYWITAAIRRAIRDKRSLIRVPAWVQDGRADPVKHKDDIAAAKQAFLPHVGIRNDHCESSCIGDSQDSRTGGHNETKKQVSNLLSHLNSRETEVVRYSFGLGGKKLNCEEIAGHIGVHRNTVAKIRDRAIRKMQEAGKIAC